MAGAAATGIATLKKRADFKRIAKGIRRNSIAFTLQAAPAGFGDGRFGLTVTRKIGTATERNRIRRRLKAAFAALNATPGVDVVVLARRECLSRPFAMLEADLSATIAAAARKLSTPAPR